MARPLLDRERPTQVSVWGVVNVTPDSFSDGGLLTDAAAAVAFAEGLVAHGANVIDVGGESTRPGASRVSTEEELARVLPVVERLAQRGVTVSIDTSRAAVAAAAVAAGARIVNDVTGGLGDPEMLATVAATDAEVVLMHWRAPSDVMDSYAQYQNVTLDVTEHLHARVAAAVACGIPPHRVIVDPGFGFAKDAQQNWQLMAELAQCVASFADDNVRTLVGVSRKRFIGHALSESGLPAEPVDRDVATAVLSFCAAQAGAWAVRVHQVAYTRQALSMFDAMQRT